MTLLLCSLACEIIHLMEPGSHFGPKPSAIGCGSPVMPITCRKVHRAYSSTTFTRTLDSRSSSNYDTLSIWRDTRTTQPRGSNACGCMMVVPPTRVLVYGPRLLRWEAAEGSSEAACYLYTPTRMFGLYAGMRGGLGHFSSSARTQSFNSRLSTHRPPPISPHIPKPHLQTLNIQKNFFTSDPHPSNWPMLTRKPPPDNNQVITRPYTLTRDRRSDDCLSASRYQT